MSMELVIDGLAVIGAGTCVYVALKALFTFLAWVQRSEIERQKRETEGGAPQRPLPPRRDPAEDDDIPPEYVAAIAAAVAMLGGHRVVFIQDSAGGQSWSHEGRWMHQTSHRTR